MMMYDLRGKQVMMRNITSAHTTLDVVDLKPGVYVVRLESGEETITRKFVKH
jgi:Fe2+ transport system protein B